MQSEGEHPGRAVAPIQMNSPASASFPRVDDEHRGPAVQDAYELSWCRIALLEASEGWPIPDDLPPLLIEFSQRIPEDQRSDWLRRQTASDEVTRLISYAMRTGELPIWIAPKDGPERLVAPSAMLEVDHATVVSGCYQPPNDRGWLYGRPLFVKRPDWDHFLESVTINKSIGAAEASPHPAPIGGDEDMSEGDASSDAGWLKGLPPGWIDGFICARRMFRLLKREVADGDPAPWLEVPNAEYWGDHWGRSAAEYTYGEKMNARAVAIFQRAIGTGELVASWFDGRDFHQVPRSAFERQGIAKRAMLDGRLEVDPSWPDDWQHWNYHGWAIPKDAFDKWLASGRALELDGLPHVDFQIEIAAINRRLPSDARRVSLSEAVTWIAFGMALDSERLARAVQWGRLCDGDLRAAQGKLEQAATALLTAATDGHIPFTGRHVETRDQKGALTRPIDPLALRDYRLIEIYHHDSLHYGTGFKHEYRTPIDTILHGSDRDDYYSEVAVERAELMKLFPANEPDATQTKNDPIVWADFGADAAPELARLADQAGRDEWWTWPEAIAWVGSTDLRNIATLRYWSTWWRSQAGGDDPTIILAGQDDIARRLAADAETRLVAAIERGSVGTSGRSARDARASHINKDDWRGGIVAYAGGTANLVSRNNLNAVWAFDIEVSRADLLAHFPPDAGRESPLDNRPPSAASLTVYPTYDGRTYDWPVWAAVEYIRNVIGDTDEGNHYPATLTAIRQAALDNKVVLFGRRELPPPKPAGFHSEVWTRIRPEYWEDHKLNVLSTEAEWQFHDHTWPEPETVGVSRARYWSLLLNRAEVEAYWPMEWHRSQELFRHWRRTAEREFQRLCNEADRAATLADRSFGDLHINALMSAAAQPVADLLNEIGSREPPFPYQARILADATMIYDDLAIKARRAVAGAKPLTATGLAIVESEQWLAKARFERIVTGWKVDDPTLDQFPPAPEELETSPPPARAPSVKGGRPPSDEDIIAKADEMKARGLAGYEIAKQMRHEPGFANVATTAVRELIKGRWSGGRPSGKLAS